MKDEIALHDAVQRVRARDPRFAPEAYDFLCKALEHAVRLLKRESVADRHVAGPELLAGFRDLVLREFGPLGWCVMREWGITCSEDVGGMVYQLIGVGYLKKNEADSLEDFADGVSLEQALTKPFRPSLKS